MYVCIYYCMCVIMVVCMYRIQYKAKPEQDVFVKKSVTKQSTHVVQLVMPILLLAKAQ